MARDPKSSRQLDLFGAPPAAPRRSRPILPARAEDDLRKVAAALPTDLRMGTSSWSFPGWRGIVYDRKASKSRLAREGLAAYARHPLLRTVGVDRTFYAPLLPEDFSAYAAAVPDDFRFLVKAAGRCTMPLLRDDSGRLAEPNSLFLDSAFAAEEVVGPFQEGLGEKAGPLVFQFPPLGRRIAAEPRRFAERLHGFLADLPTGPWYAVELRNRELFGEPYLDALRASGARHCFNVHPRMLPLTEQLAGAPDQWREGPLAVRWMLHSGLDYEEALERYEPFDALVDEDVPTRETLAQTCVEEVAAPRPIVIVANNKAEGSAPLTVGKLARAIAARRTTP